MKKDSFLNTYINNISKQECIQRICNYVDNKQRAYIVPINVDVVVKMEEDEYLKEIVNNADLTLVDGQPLIWISKLQNKPIKEKISGSDLVPELCQIASIKQYTLFIIGGKEGVANDAKKEIEKRYKNINIVGTYSPAFGFEKDKDEIDKINKIINDANPDILVVCFGCPKQEKWIYENYNKYNATVSICAGATVDFLANRIKRAPKWMSNNGLEWFYRFLKEPTRLFRRYFIEDIKILNIFLKYK